jgi:hypothetical protein
MQRYDNLLEIGFKHDEALRPNEDAANLPKARSKKQKKAKNLLDRLQTIKLKPCLFKVIL